MIIVGLTGGIASGKSTILNFLKTKKVPVHDSDLVVQNLYKNSSKELINHLKTIGLNEAIKQNKINKKIIRKEALNNKIILKKIEKFIHNKVRISREKFIKKNKESRKKIVVLDIPLLFENKLENICDYVFLAYSPTKIRISRALKRRNLNEDNIKKILKLQMPDKKKIIKSDFVINTSINKKNTYEQTISAINVIIGI